MPNKIDLPLPPLAALVEGTISNEHVDIAAVAPAS